MADVSLTLDADLVTLLEGLNQPLEDAARELMVLELYRRGAISSGKAAEQMKRSRWEFVRYASQLDIPFFEMSQGEWELERIQANAQ